MKSWAISGVDLHLELTGPRVGASLERGLREAVQSGRLAPGTRLPASRALAVDLGVARNTVAAAYAHLVAEGWLTSRQGSGTHVAPRPADAVRVMTPAPAQAKALRYSLRAGLPDLSNFPRADWLKSARAALARTPAAALGPVDPQGSPQLRDPLASYLARARGVRADADSVIVCAGFNQALWLLGRALRANGVRAVGIEGYGHPIYRDVLADAGLRVGLLAVDDSGARLDHTAGYGAVVLTAAHQFPLGVALSAQRRSEFVRWAAASGGYVIEDDYDGEFRYDRRAIGAMQALAPGRVVYAGTASKTLAPGLRLGWLVVPPELRPAVLAAHRVVNAHTAVLDQLTMAELIESGRYDRHVRRARLAYRHRRDRLVAALARRVPDVAVHGLPAGMHVLVELPAGLTERDAVERAAARGLEVEPLGDYALAPDGRPPALVIGYATPPAHAYTAAIARLCATLAPGSWRRLGRPVP